MPKACCSHDAQAAAAGRALAAFGGRRSILWPEGMTDRRAGRVRQGGMQSIRFADILRSVRIASAALLLLLAVAGCARSPARPPEPAALPRSPLALAALAEWEVWGRPTVIGWPSSRLQDTAATPERFERLIDYWEAIPGGSRVASRHRQLRMAIRGALDAPAPAESPLRPVSAAVRWEDVELYATPAWSAAFISAVARLAGMPHADLPSTSRHARYIDAALARWRADPAGAAFVPHAPEDYAPVPGDLVCADRSAVPLAHWTMLYASAGRPRPMHCDVVVRTAPGVVEMIGGNVQEMVTLRRLPADARGRMLPAPPGFPVFILILQAREAPATTPILPGTAPEAEQS